MKYMEYLANKEELYWLQQIFEKKNNIFISFILNLLIIGILFTYYNSQEKINVSLYVFNQLKKLARLYLYMKDVIIRVHRSKI